MADHNIDAQNIRGLNHVDATGPQCGARALPQVATVQSNGVVPSTGLFAQSVKQGF